MEAAIEASLNKNSPGPESTQEKLLQVSGKRSFLLSCLIKY